MSVIFPVTGNSFAWDVGRGRFSVCNAVAPLNQAQAQTITPVHTKLTADFANGGSYGKTLKSHPMAAMSFIWQTQLQSALSTYFSAPINGGTAMS